MRDGMWERSRSRRQARGSLPQCPWGLETFGMGSGWAMSENGRSRRQAGGQWLPASARMASGRERPFPAGAFGVVWSRIAETAAGSRRSDQRVMPCGSAARRHEMEMKTQGHGRSGRRDRACGSRMPAARVLRLDRGTFANPDRHRRPEPAHAVAQAERACRKAHRKDMAKPRLPSQAALVPAAPAPATDRPLSSSIPGRAPPGAARMVHARPAAFVRGRPSLQMRWRGLLAAAVPEPPPRAAAPTATVCCRPARGLPPRAAAPSLSCRPGRLPVEAGGRPWGPAAATAGRRTPQQGGRALHAALSPRLLCRCVRGRRHRGSALCPKRSRPAVACGRPVWTTALVAATWGLRLWFGGDEA